MSLILSITVIIVSIFSFLQKKEQVLLWIFIFTIINGMFEFNVGFAVKVYHFIALLYLHRIINFYSKNPVLKKKFNPLKLEFILMMIMGIVFGFIFKFEDPFQSYRTTTQLSEWRTLISGGRLFLELVSLLLVVFWLKTNTFSIDYIVKVIAITTIITVALAFIIFYTEGIVYKLLFPYWEYVTERMKVVYDFRGLVGEPKTFGRTNAFLLISILFFGKLVNKSIRFLAIILSLIGIIVSLSASSLIVASVGLSLFVLTQRKISNILLLIFFGLIAIAFLNENSNFNNNTLRKINYVLSSKNEDRLNEGKVRANEPEIFTRFEIFDRAALNFLYYNPQYLFFGVGPNTISIPASKYVSYRMKRSEVHGYGLNTAPATLIVNIISRSGLMGLLLYFIFLRRIYISLNKMPDGYSFIILTIMSFITHTTIIFIFYGIFLYLASTSHYTKYNKPVYG